MYYENWNRYRAMKTYMNKTLKELVIGKKFI